MTTGIMDWLFNYSSSQPIEIFLDGTRKKLKLSSKKLISHNSYIFQFSFENSNAILGLPVAKHIRFYAPNPKGKIEGYWNGKPTPNTPEISRKYTPISKISEKGHVDFLIKIYRPSEDLSYPDGGKMSQYLEKLEIGETLEVEGPLGISEYMGKGKFISRGHEFTKTKIGMIAGGSGLTPFYQLSQAILSESDQPITLSLLYANQTTDDILFKAELDKLQENYPDKFRVSYTVDKADETWKSYVGYINEQMIIESLPPPSNDTAIFVCGPPPMIQYACMPNLRNLGYDMNYVMKL